MAILFVLNDRDLNSAQSLIGKCVISMTVCLNINDEKPHMYKKGADNFFRVDALFSSPDISIS